MFTSKNLDNYLTDFNEISFSSPKGYNRLLFIEVGKLSRFSPTKQQHKIRKLRKLQNKCNINNKRRGFRMKCKVERLIEYVGRGMRLYL